MTTDIIIRPPETEARERELGLLVAQANEIAVTTNDERELAGQWVNQVVNPMLKAIEAEFDGSQDRPGPVTLAHRTWKSMVALRDRILKPAETAKATVNAKINRFEWETEQKRLKEQARLEAQARQKAEEERKKAIEAARKAKDFEAAKSLKEAPLVVAAAPPRTPEVPKVEGMRRSAPVWKFEIVNPELLPRKYWIPDEKGIGATVRSLGERHGIPGIRVWDSRSEGV